MTAPMSTPEEQRKQEAQRERRESTIGIMASWALEGMEPTPDVLSCICSYVNGEVTLDEAITQAKAPYAPGE